MFFFQLFPQGLSGSSSSISSVFCILFSYTSYLHALCRHVHKSPLRSSFGPAAMQLHPQHPSTFPLSFLRKYRAHLSLVLTPSVCSPSVLTPDPLHHHQAQQKLTCRCWQTPSVLDSELQWRVLRFIAANRVVFINVWLPCYLSVAFP